MTKVLIKDKASFILSLILISFIIPAQYHMRMYGFLGVSAILAIGPLENCLIWIIGKMGRTTVSTELYRSKKKNAK